LYLHSKGVIHRDIAARNVLVTSDFSAKICDLGLSRVLTTFAKDYAVTDTPWGPARWMPPEAILKSKYSKESDIYSFGVFLWELVTRQVPFEKYTVFQVAIGVSKEGWTLPLPKPCDPIFSKIITKCLKSEPSKRPSMDVIVQKLEQYHVQLKRQRKKRRETYFCPSPQFPTHGSSASNLTTNTNTNVNIKQPPPPSLETAGDLLFFDSQTFSVVKNKNNNVNGKGNDDVTAIVTLKNDDVCGDSPQQLEGTLQRQQNKAYDRQSLVQQGARAIGEDKKISKCKEVVEVLFSHNCILC